MRRSVFIISIFLALGRSAVADTQSAILKQAALRPVTYMATAPGSLVLARPDGSITLVDLKVPALKEFTPITPGRTLGLATSGSRVCWVVTSESTDAVTNRPNNTLYWVDRDDTMVHGIDLTGSGNLSRDRLMMPDADRAILVRGTAGMEINFHDSNIKFADSATMEKVAAQLPDEKLVPDIVRNTLMAQPTKLCRSGDDQWAILGGSIVRFNDTTHSAHAFLAWNLKDLTVSSIAADESGLWAFTNSGIRHIQPDGKPDPALGFDGFIRIAYGSERDLPFNVACQKLGAEMNSWLGAPYKYGGVSKSTGVDCSGFVMQAYRAAGITLDHGSDYLRTCRQGVVVHDELRYGDVLVFPGHCAIYVGNGATMEAQDGGVGKHLLYHRTEVVVRRLIDAPRSAIDTTTFGSRSKTNKKRG
ncbi:MAG: C40 family peptidase [Chthonomonadales bacterium]